MALVNLTKKSILFLLISVLMLLSSFSIVNADYTVIPVHAEICHINGSGTNLDTVANVPIAWDSGWMLGLANDFGSGSTIVNPKYELRTDKNFIQFNPCSPDVFTANPPDYTWSFSGLNIDESQNLSPSLTEQTITAKPGYSASRTVVPEILSSPITLQTVTLTFKLEEKLPDEVNLINVMISSPIDAYMPYKLVQTSIISQTEVNGWHSQTDGITALWNADPSNVEIGKIYQFSAVVRSEKSPDLLGSPVFKPGVGIFYGQWLNIDSCVTGKSVTISTPDNSATCTFSNDNTLNWRTNYCGSRFDFWFHPVVSQITEPPYHVLIPANVRIEPQTINAKSNGVITAFVDLPSAYNVRDIDVSTVQCQGALALRGTVADHTLIVKFNRQDLQGLVIGQDCMLHLKGELKDGSIFTAETKVKVI